MTMTATPVRVIVTPVFYIDQLEGEARQKARDWMREAFYTFDWWDADYKDFETIGEMMGFDGMDICFSGFYSQGDGASFTGVWTRPKAFQGTLEEYAPKDKKLHAIARKLREWMEKHPKAHGAKIARTDMRYSHEYSVDVNHLFDECGDDLGNCEAEREFIAIARDFMKWMYATLGNTYEGMTSDAGVDEDAMANEYTFTSDGERMN